jgi:hypothetical protein
MTQVRTIAASIGCVALGLPGDVHAHGEASVSVTHGLWSPYDGADVRLCESEICPGAFVGDALAGPEQGAFHFAVESELREVLLTGRLIVFPGDGHHSSGSHTIAVVVTESSPPRPLESGRDSLRSREPEPHASAVQPPSPRGDVASEELRPIAPLSVSPSPPGRRRASRLTVMTYFMNQETNAMRMRETEILLQPNPEIGHRPAFLEAIEEPPPIEAIGQDVSSHVRRPPGRFGI